jgi:non-ribosomal peptide synthetase component F
VIIDATRLAEPIVEDAAVALPAIAPTTLLYIVFTSGSTGVPKGVVICHQSMSSALVHLRSRRSVGPQTRELAFSSLAFDSMSQSIL